MVAGGAGWCGAGRCGGARSVVDGAESGKLNATVLVRMAGDPSAMGSA